MASPSPTECSVCNETFDEAQHCPRLLPCYHCVCSRCIESLIENGDRKCPYCRQVFCGDSPAEFRVSSNIVDLVKYIADLEENAVSSDMLHNAKILKKIEYLMKQNKASLHKGLEECKNALDMIKQSIQKSELTEEHIISFNEEIKNEILTIVSEVVAKNESKVQALRVRCQVMKSLQKEMEVMHATLLGVQELVEECTATTFEEAAPVMDEVEETNGSLQEMLDKFKGLMSESSTVVHHEESEVPPIES